MKCTKVVCGVSSIWLFKRLFYTAQLQELIIKSHQNPVKFNQNTLTWSSSRYRKNNCPLQLNTSFLGLNQDILDPRKTPLYVFEIWRSLDAFKKHGTPCSCKHSLIYFGFIIHHIVYMYIFNKKIYFCL